ncbi:ABC transporter substrate-binding protein [Modestobacter sp. VKM Ac-2979]|uniref:ABC transporter substrate-binding protein n=1 Tax=unclassified Modestobacter TaxID=2643866 RepID=UPI0022AB71DC|nr:MULTISPECIES: ABC transporter substrate-binding protein [unclassified Modestobacter]MCZ2813803.1 ABC transporter substrate-binding protein [Modestobacter sp. VKM Ac-2979]MCZ2844222.1 ABC transporter substrate-binding protein [Modestobacter sp. VKM Ac-2980]
MSPQLVRRAIAGTVAATTVLALAACSSDSAEAGGSDDGGTETVTIGTLRGQPHFYAPFLYEEYAPEGVEFEVVVLDTAPSLTDAVISGDVDFSITGVVATIASVAQDRDITLVASAADGGFGFIGGEGIETVADLTGKTVGYIQGSAPEIAMRLILEENGIDPSSVELIAVPPPEMASALGSGSIDAFFGTEIAVSLATAAGATELTDPYATPIGRVNLGLTTTGALIEEDPELVQAVVDTHAATTEYMADNIDEWLPEMVAEFGGDQDVFESALDNFWLRADLSEEYQTQVEALADAMVSLDVIDTAPTAADLVDTSFAPSA